VHVFPEGVLVTVYWVIGRPLTVGVGAVHRTVAFRLPGTAVGVPGAAGAVAGIRWAPTDGPLVPASLIATTVNPYVVPSTKPLTVHESDPVVEQVLPVGLLVAV
jgi:hypothetical protein